MKISIIYGGISSEREVSISSAKSIYNSIVNDYEVSMHDFDGDYNGLKNEIKNKDLVFNALHGGDGEDGTMQRFLELNNIKYTGSNSKSSEIAMNKILCKEICLKHNIPTPTWHTAFNNQIQMWDSVVVKPSDGGSSIGLTIIKKNSLNKLNSAILKCSKVSKEILIEEFVDGRELTVGILNNKALPVIEIIPKGQFYDYNCKYVKGRSEYVIPAKINKIVEQNIKEYSLKIHQEIGCDVYSRVDYRLNNKNEIYFLEINTLPGFTDTSLFPKAALEIGLKYKELINKIIKLSL